MLLRYCTLTGVDEKTALIELVLLSTRYPFVEWGLLYSPKRKGLPGRYPGVNYLKLAMEALPSDIRVALHVCGSGVTDLLDGEPVITSLAELVRARSGRLQLNFNMARRPLNHTHLNNYIKGFQQQVITQRNEKNAGLVVAVDAPNHAVLFDESGGTGRERQDWPTSLPGVFCGYAGGLGPDNLAAQLQLIHAKVGNRPYWIDMEGELRDAEDRFDLFRAEQCLAVVRDFMTGTERSSI